MCSHALAQAAAPAAAAPAAAAPATAVARDLVAAPAAGEPAPAPHSAGLIEVIMRAGWFGLLVWICLVICSVVSVALIWDSYVTIQEKKIAPSSLVEDVRNALAQGDLLKAMQCCDNSPTPLARILKAGFSNAEEGFEVVQDSVGVAADLEGEKLLQRVTYLSVISNTSPMLGLIGTVQGMIMAFANIGMSAAGAATTALLAMNISHGLWATAVGLGTAVPAGIYFFYFKNRATRIILHQEALTLDLIKSLRNVEVVHD
jgi:biopolymer transport protein ExbB